MGAIIPEPEIIRAPDGKNNLLILGCSEGRRLFFFSTTYMNNRRQEIRVSLKGPKMSKGEFRKAAATARKLLGKKNCRTKVLWEEWKNIDPKAATPRKTTKEIEW